MNLEKKRRRKVQLNNIPDNAVVVLQGSDLKQLLQSMKDDLSKQIEQLGNPARWVKMKEACEVLGCSKSTMNRHIKSGLITPARHNRDLTFCLADLIAFKRNQQIHQE